MTENIKLLSADQIRQLDAKTLSIQKVTSKSLMFRAASKCFLKMLEELNPMKSVHVICGTGNNGGDGLVIALLLAERGFDVNLSVLDFMPEPSEDFSHYYKIVEGNDSIRIEHFSEAESFEQDHKQVIDAILGSGTSRPITGWLLEIVKRINQSGVLVLSVDVPSGIPVFPDFIPSIAIESSMTFTFQVPKLSLYLPEYGSYTKRFEIIDIGLEEKVISDFKTNYSIYYPDKKFAMALHRNRFLHKGSMGKAMIVAGNGGMPGAAIFSCRSALVAGCGILYCSTNKGSAPVIQTNIPEAIVQNETKASELVNFLMEKEINTVSIGPGMGASTITKSIVIAILKGYTGKIILDADALNVLSSDGHWLELCQKSHSQFILTPHPGEFDRLFGSHESTWTRIQTARRVCMDNVLTIILKGAFPAVVNASGEVTFINSGHPAMAKAGSGDVLTGLLTGLWSRSDLNGNDVACLGCHIHGVAGTNAANINGSESVLASDIVNQLGRAIEKYKAMT